MLVYNQDFPSEKVLLSEKNDLLQRSSTVLIEHIKAAIQSLVKNRVSEATNLQTFGSSSEVSPHEELLRKHEDEIRSLIKDRHHLQLFIDTQQEKFDEMEYKYSGALKRLEELEKITKAKDSEVVELREKNKSLEMKVSSLELSNKRLESRFDKINKIDNESERAGRCKQEIEKLHKKYKEVNT